MGTSNVLNHRLPADSTGDNKNITGGSHETGTGQNLKTFTLTYKIDMSSTEIERIMVPVNCKIIEVAIVIQTLQGVAEQSTVNFDAPEGFFFQAAFLNVPAGAGLTGPITNNNNLSKGEQITISKTSFGAANTLMTVVLLFEIL